MTTAVLSADPESNERTHRIDFDGEAGGQTSDSGSSKHHKQLAGAATSTFKDISNDKTEADVYMSTSRF